MLAGGCYAVTPRIRRHDAGIAKQLTVARWLQEIGNYFCIPEAKPNEEGRRVGASNPPHNPHIFMGFHETN